jgi:hypothetical protein
MLVCYQYLRGYFLVMRLVVELMDLQLTASDGRACVVGGMVLAVTL